jgi:hypothetical protein
MRWCLPTWKSVWLCCALAGLGMPGMAQTPAETPVKVNGSGNWKQLKAHEKAALAPLASRWGELTETQRGKWLAIAQQFDKLSAAEQQVMQARMTEWVALSPVQRNQARLNFSTVQGVSKDEKKNRWDEYQALSEQEKRRLSARVLAPTRTTAPSPKPTAPERLVQPNVRTMPAAALPPRTPVDSKTLLPIPVPPASVPVDAPSAPAESGPARDASAS